MVKHDSTFSLKRLPTVGFANDIARQTFPKSLVILTGSANEISLDLPVEDLWMECVDATQIHQVFINLVVNARDALPHSRSIVATATNLLIDDTNAKLPINVLCLSLCLDRDY